jgi:DnaJ family protein C protein 1
MLTLPAQATASELKKAFYKVSLQLHPDKNRAPNAEAQYREVVNAYEVLSDSVSRANYDDALSNPDRFFTNTYQYYQYRAGLHHTALWKVLGKHLTFRSSLR